MTKFIPVAFAIVAFGASLSPALATGSTGSGDRVADTAFTATYNQAAPVAASASVVPTYHYSDAEAAIINQNAHDTGR